jgi:hypothetical protein
MGAKRRGKRGEGEPRFYCESCGKQVAPDVSSCPHCGMPFYAVKCPSCGHTGRAVDFVDGCPSCGYLAVDGSFGPAEGAYPPNSESEGRSRRSSGSRNAGGVKKGGELPGWIFFIVLLILGSLFAGSAMLYLNM